MDQPHEAVYSSFAVLNELRLQGKLCDVVIKVDEAEFKVHKLVLCSCSPYFLTLFDSRWSNPERKVYNIPGLSSDMMRLIIEYTYTDSVPVTEENIEELLAAADQFDIKGIVDACCEFLEKQLCSDNCIGIWRFVNLYYCPELKHKAHLFILHHFEEVATSEEFLQLSVEQLADFIQKDDLNVKQEKTVFEAIVRWISHLPKDRKRHTTTLLSKVRLALMSTEYFIKNVKNHALVKANSECRPIISNALKALTRLNTGSILDYKSPLSRPRLPHAVMLAIGGWSGGGTTNGIEAYDPRTDHWVSVTYNDQRPRAYHGVAFLNGIIYCIGGTDGFEKFNSGRKFDLGTRTWHEVAPMHSRRCYVSVAVLNGYIYAMGGHDGHRRINTVERYKPSTNQWTLMAPMHEQRSDASATTLHGKAYNPANNVWHTVPSMLTPRSNFGIEVVDDLLFVVGGFNSIMTTFHVERYDDTAGEWSEVHEMEIPRSAVSCCVLHGLPNMAEYAPHPAVEDDAGDQENLSNA
uniref:Kelch like family member 10 n=1 Tax=Myripristis murdjan TaxID=586833 RepID=A0A667WFC7_9TELE